MMGILHPPKKHSSPSVHSLHHLHTLQEDPLRDIIIIIITIIIKLVEYSCFIVLWVCVSVYTSLTPAEFVSERLVEGSHGEQVLCAAEPDDVVLSVPSCERAQFSLVILVTQSNRKHWHTCIQKTCVACKS